ncbi:MAG: DcrB-related protein [bacterium]
MRFMWQNVKWVGFLLLFVIFGISCQKGQPSKIMGQVYENKVHNFSIEFPESWKVDESGVLGSIVIFKEQKFRKDFSANINVFAEKTKFDVNEYTDITVNQHGSVFKGYKLIKKENEKISGLDAIVVDYEYRYGIVGMLQVRSCYVKHDGKMFSITATALQEEISKYNDKFNKTIREFKVLQS